MLQANSKKNLRTCKSLLWTLFFLSFNVGTSRNAAAQVFGEAARTEFFGGWGVRIFYSRINTPKVFVNVAPVAVVYGALPKLSLIAVFPTITRTFEQGINRETDFGLGDITLLAKYRFYKKDVFLGSRQLAGQVGVELPTGADDLEDDQGNRLPPPLQLGSGSVDYQFALTFTEAHDRITFSGDLGYTFNTEANDFEFGDVFNYNAAAKFRIYPARFKDDGPLKQHFIFLELNGVVSQKAKLAGRSKINDSGGHQIFLAPGFQFFVLENFLFEAGIQIPLLQDLNGSQPGTDFHVRTGLRWIVSP